MAREQILTNQGVTRYREARANGVNAASLQAPATLAGDYDIFLLAALPGVEEFLTIDAAGQLSTTSIGAGSLDDAYNIGDTITADAGPVVINSSTNTVLDLNQSGDFFGLRVDKTGVGLGNAVNIADAGTGTTLNVGKTGAAGTVLILGDLNSGLTFGSANGLDVQVGGTPTFTASFLALADPSTSMVQINAFATATVPCLEIIGNTNVGIILTQTSTGIDVTSSTTGIDVTAPLGMLVTAGITGGVSITQANAASCLTATGGTASAIVASNANDNRVMTLTKTGLGIGSVLFAENDGTGNCVTLQQDGVAANGALFLDVNGNCPGLAIDSEATAEPLIELAPVTGNTRGDIAFGAVRAADPTTPSEGDVWYNEALERFKFQLPGQSGRQAARTFGSLWGPTFGPHVDKTISGNAITVTSGHTRLESQIDPGIDDLDDITASPAAEEGDVIMISSLTTSTVTVRDGVGNIFLTGSVNRVLNGFPEHLILVFNVGNWYEWGYEA